jgi:hypothetical protein
MVIRMVMKLLPNIERVSAKLSPRKSVVLFQLELHKSISQLHNYFRKDPLEKYTAICARSIWLVRTPFCDNLIYC